MVGMTGVHDTTDVGPARQASFAGFGRYVAGLYNWTSKACSGVNSKDNTGGREKRFEKLTTPMMNFLVKRFTQAGLLCGDGAGKTATAGF